MTKDVLERISKLMPLIAECVDHSTHIATQHNCEDVRQLQKDVEAALAAYVDQTNTSPERVQKTPGNVHVMQMALDALEYHAAPEIPLAEQQAKRKKAKS